MLVSLETIVISGNKEGTKSKDGIVIRSPCPIHFKKDTLLPPTLCSISLTMVDVEHLPDSVSFCRNLSFIKVSNCNLVALPENLQKLQANLNQLSLPGNKLTLEGVRRVLVQMPSLCNGKYIDFRGKESDKTLSLAGNSVLTTELAKYLGIEDTRGVPLSSALIPHLIARDGGMDEDDRKISGETKMSGLRKYSHKELSNATLSFSKEHRLISSEGAFGPVYHGTFGSSQHVAVKVMRGVSLHSTEQLMRELDALHRCRHPHVLSLVGYSLDGPKCLVYDYKERGSLENLIMYASDKASPKNNNLSWQRRLCIIGQIISAIEYLHTVADPPIIHRDIKSANILVDASFNASLGDFGLARLSPEFSDLASGGQQSMPSTRIFGTPGYIDPEYSQSGKVSKLSDVFSFGIVALELLSSTRPYDSTQHPPWILDRFEDCIDYSGKGRSEVLRAFCPEWPSAVVEDIVEIVKYFVERRSRRRPNSSVAAAQINEIVDKFGCNPAQLQVQENSSEAECVICLDRPASHAMIPCGHRCICSLCAAETKKKDVSFLRCPICRAKFKSIVQIFVDC
jgi:hypothetical protein